MNWLLMGYRKCFDFKSRSRRKEFWVFCLWNWIIFWVIGNMRSYILKSTLFSFWLCLIGIYLLFFHFSLLSLSIRRLHDINKSGWNVFWAFIPLPLLSLWIRLHGINKIEWTLIYLSSGYWWYILFLMTREGDATVNRYGPNPKEDATVNSDSSNTEEEATVNSYGSNPKEIARKEDGTNPKKDDILVGTTQEETTVIRSNKRIHPVVGIIIVIMILAVCTFLVHSPLTSVFLKSTTNYLNGVICYYLKYDYFKAEEFLTKIPGTYLNNSEILKNSRIKQAESYYYYREYDRAISKIEQVGDYNLSLWSAACEAQYEKCLDLYCVQKDYRNAWLQFKKLPAGYKKRDIYLALLSAKLGGVVATDESDIIMENLDFEDALTLVFTNDYMSQKFLLGTWTSGNIYLVMDQDGYIQYNIFSTASGTYNFQNGTYSITTNNGNVVKTFEFSAQSRDTIKVYSYEDGKTYTLYRKKTQSTPAVSTNHYENIYSKVENMQLKLGSYQGFFTGDYNSVLASGNGTWISVDGKYTYEGGIQNGVRHGKGIYTYIPLETKQVGIWEKGHEQGEHIFTFPPSSKLEDLHAEFKNNKIVSAYIVATTGEKVYSTQNEIAEFNKALSK